MPSATIIAQGASRIDNIIHRLLAPHRGQKVVVTLTSINVDLLNDAAVGVLQSKEWFEWDDESVPLNTGTALIFRVQSQVVMPWWLVCRQTLTNVTDNIDSDESI